MISLMRTISYIRKATRDRNESETPETDNLGSFWCQSFMVRWIFRCSKNVSSWEITSNVP